MITSRRPPRYRKLLVLAIVLSLFVHFFGGYFLTRFVRMSGPIEEQKRAEGSEPPSMITIERRTPPKPVVATAPPVTKPEPITPEVPKLPQPKVLAPPPAPAPARHTARSLPKTRPEVAHIVVHAPRQEAKSQGEGTPNNSKLSSDQIAQIESKFSKTIADSHTDIKAITAQVQDSQPVATKHYSTQFNGIHGDLRRGQGYIYPLGVGERRGNFVYYYTHYEYMYADGHVEQDDIPWPYVFPINHDLFALGVREIPVQPPPPGFKLTRQLQPMMMKYFGGPDPGQ
jgi:hypothetical protein